MKFNITKLDTHKLAQFKENPHGTFKGELMSGESDDYPKVGESFHFSSDSSYPFIITSIVKSVYIKDTDQDKLVLPSNFPEASDLNFDDIKLNSNDVLFATNNSIYLMTDIQK